MNSLTGEIKTLKNQLQATHFPTRVLSHEKRLVYYTGVPHLKAFNWILSVTENFVTTTFKLPKQQQLLLTFIKLRHALNDIDISVRFNISRRTVRRIIEAWLPVLAGRLRHLIFWPKRDLIKKIADLL